MTSAENEGKSLIERFMRTLQNRIWKYVTSIGKIYALVS